MADSSNLVSVTLPHLREIRRSTVGETYQYLNLLVKGKSIENLDEVVSSGTPLPAFEESLRLMLIDHLHWESEVVKVLLSQDDCQIKRILNCRWFFQNLPSEFCTAQLFPFVSQSVRCKIINRLSKHLNNEEEAEKYFAFIRANYDNARANYLLPRCSSQFILNHFQRNMTTFKQTTQDRVLFNICKKCPEVGIRILSSIFDVKKKDEPDFHRYRKILSYLSGNHPDLMVPFLINHRPVIPDGTFGRRLTRKLATRLKDRLFPDFVSKLLFKERYLLEILSLEEKKKFVATIVGCGQGGLTHSNWINMDDRICELLKMVPPECRMGIIEAAFKEVYSSNFSDSSPVWSSEILELLPIDVRQPYAAKLERLLRGNRSEFQKGVNAASFDADIPEEIFYLYDTRTAFQKLKEQLQRATAVGRRERILAYMVKNCRINNDVKALEEIVEFVATRHRNDDASVVYSFLRNVCENFPATALNSNIYEKLEDLAYFFALKGHKNDYVGNMCTERHILHRLENGMDADDLVGKLFESAVPDRFHHSAFLQDLRSRHSRALVLSLCKKTTDLIREKWTGAPLPENLGNMLSGVLITCSAFNRQNKKDKIFLREIPGLNEILRVQLREGFRDAGGESWPLDIWDRYHDDLTNVYYKPRHLLYALRRDPTLAEKHMQGILNILFTEYYRVYNELLNFFKMAVSFFGKTDQLKGIILNEFEHGAPIHRRKNALALYSRVCTHEEFGKAIDAYLPRGEKVQGRAEGGFDQIQISIPPLIKNVTPRWRNLETILKFFFGDFLKSVLTSFFSCCHHTRCDLAIPFLKRHLNDVPQRVSYKKEIIRLLLQLSDRRGRSEFCRRGWTEHPHHSLRCILLREVGKSFLEQPSRDSFALLEKCVLECDDVTIEARPALRKIPEEYWNDYVSALWRFSEDKEHNFRSSFLTTILWDFDRQNVAWISPELGESIIKNDLFVPTSEIEVERFAALYLAADPQAVHHRVNVVLDLIETRKADAAAVDKFLTALMDVSWEHPAHFVDVFTAVLDNWPRYPLGVLFKQKALFTYHNLHQKVVKTTPEGHVAEEFGRRLRNFFQDVRNLKDLIPVYSEPLLRFLSKFETGKVLRAVGELVAGAQDRTLAVLALTSLPDGLVGWYQRRGDVFSREGMRDRKLMEELVGLFESFDDDVVQIYFRTKFEFQKVEAAFEFGGEGDCE